MIEGRALRATDADRRKMRRFIASQLVDGEGCFVLASGHDGAINVHLAVDGNDLTIESDEPEAVSLSDVYEHYRWAMMSASEQRRLIASVADVPSPLDRSGGSAGPKPSNGVAGVRRSSRRRPVASEMEMTLRICDVAKRLGCSYSAARDRMLDGRIKSFRDGGLVWTTEQCLNAFLDERSTAGNEPSQSRLPIPRRRASGARFEKGGVADRFLRRRRQG